MGERKLADLTVEELREMIRDEVASSAPPAKPSPWMTTRRAAEHFQVCQSTVQKWVAKGAPGVRRVGPRNIRVNVDELQRWLAGESQPLSVVK